MAVGRYLVAGVDETTRVRWQHARENVDEGALPGSVLPYQGKYFTLPDPEAHVFKNPVPTERLGKILRLEH
jgi:hypothetical protein